MKGLALYRCETLPCTRVSLSVTGTDYSYDALDRTVKETETHDEWSGTTRTTKFSYQGLSDLVTEERITGKNPTTKTYSYDAFGHRISLTNDPDDPAKETKTYTYGYDVHGSVSQLISQGGSVQASYGYTLYGGEDTELPKGERMFLDNRLPHQPEHSKLERSPRFRGLPGVRRETRVGAEIRQGEVDSQPSQDRCDEPKPKEACRREAEPSTAERSDQEVDRREGKVVVYVTTNHVCQRRELVGSRFDTDQLRHQKQHCERGGRYPLPARLRNGIQNAIMIHVGVVTIHISFHNGCQLSPWS